MYDRSTSTNKVIEAFLDPFARKQRPYMEFLPQKPLLLSISKDLSYKHDIHGGIRYASRTLYHRYPVGVGIKLAESGSHPGPYRHQ